jgi:ammonia channel protein AmtB
MDAQQVMRELEASLETARTVFYSFLLLLGICGAALYEVGCVREKNSQTAFRKVVLCMAVAAGCHYLWLLVWDNTGLGSAAVRERMWVHDWGVWSMGCGLLSGVLAERTKVSAIVLLAAAVNGIAYPMTLCGTYLLTSPIVSLPSIATMGLAVGSVSTVCSKVVGYRLGRYTSPIAGFSYALSSFGVLLISCGMLASIGVVSGSSSASSAYAGPLDAILCGCCAMLVVYHYSHKRLLQRSVMEAHQRVTFLDRKAYADSCLHSALLCGIVFASATADLVPVYAFALIGFVIGIVHLEARLYVEDGRLHLDDVTHGCVSLWLPSLLGLVVRSAVLMDWPTIIIPVASALVVSALSVFLFHVHDRFSPVRVSHAVEIRGMDAEETPA